MLCISGPALLKENCTYILETFTHLQYPIFIHECKWWVQTILNHLQKPLQRGTWSSRVANNTLRVLGKGGINIAMITTTSLRALTRIDISNIYCWHMWSRQLVVYQGPKNHVSVMTKIMSMWFTEGYGMKYSWSSGSQISVASVSKHPM